jgi:hypothetical protein
MGETLVFRWDVWVSGRTGADAMARKPRQSEGEGERRKRGRSTEGYSKVPENPGDDISWMEDATDEGIGGMILGWPGPIPEPKLKE